MAGQPFGPACSAVPADGEGSFGGMADDPAATAASNNPVLSTLVTAVMQAGLADTLNSEGPFTIFAPTNDAFAAIPQADLEAVLADKDVLDQHPHVPRGRRREPQGIRPGNGRRADHGRGRRAGRSAPTAPRSTAPRSCARTSRPPMQRCTSSTRC